MNLIKGEPAQKRNCELLGIRPERIDLGRDAGEWEGWLRYAEHLGSDTFACLDVAEIGKITVRIAGGQRLASGERMFLRPQAEHEHRFRGGRRV